MAALVPDVIYKMNYDSVNSDNNMKCYTINGHAFVFWHKSIKAGTVEIEIRPGTLVVLGKITAITTIFKANSIIFFQFPDVKNFSYTAPKGHKWIKDPDGRVARLFYEALLDEDVEAPLKPLLDLVKGNSLAEKFKALNIPLMPPVQRDDESSDDD